MNVFKRCDEVVNPGQVAGRSRCALCRKHLQYENCIPFHVAMKSLQPLSLNPTFTEWVMCFALKLCVL